MVQTERFPLTIHPDPRRVLFRPFHLGPERTARILDRLFQLNEEEVRRELDTVFQEFKYRHQAVEEYLERRALEILGAADVDPVGLSRERQLLAGAYFTHEYALEAAALFNPSIVWHPDQSGMPEGCRRFVISLRATGEGHISSVEFRSGFVDGEAQIWLDSYSRYVTPPDQYAEGLLSKAVFLRKVHELGMDDGFAGSLSAALPEQIGYTEAAAIIRAHEGYASHKVAADGILGLLKANYEISYKSDRALSERILFPYSPNEMNGMEDARFVAFTDDAGAVTYYATYTAYNGRVIFPQLLETEDFLRFRVRTLTGDVVRNKGMALFPRKVGGKYRMLGRQDGENIYLMDSDDLYFWHSSNLLMAPEYPWEFVQLGNCGSPIETPEGWLVLSHGVGAMRKYCIGAFLLDLEDPSRVLARLPYPLITPLEEEREGYVPNVVYTCGALLHAGKVIIPYAMSDYSTGFARVLLDDLLGALLKEGKVENNLHTSSYL
jgi:predicted GH43/DUF377 family glycosyl hydrolase